METNKEERQADLRSRLAAIRAELGYKKIQMAHLLGLSYSVYLRKENGSDRTSISDQEARLIELIESYGVPSGYTPPEEYTYDSQRHHKCASESVMASS